MDKKLKKRLIALDEKLDEILAKLSEAEEEEETEDEEDEEEEEDEEWFKCEYCGKKVQGEAKIKKHEKKCKSEHEEEDEDEESDEDEDSDKDEDEDEEVPPCYGEYPESAKGHKCKKCDFLKPCKKTAAESEEDEEEEKPKKKKHHPKAEAPASKKKVSGAHHFLKKEAIISLLKKRVKGAKVEGFNKSRQLPDLKKALQLSKSRSTKHVPEVYEQGFMVYVAIPPEPKKEKVKTKTPAKKTPTKNVPPKKKPTEKKAKAPEKKSESKKVKPKAEPKKKTDILVEDIAKEKGITIDDARELLGVVGI